MQSSLKIILVVLIVVVVLGGGAGLWYFSQLQSSVQTNTQTGSNGLPDTPGVNTGGSSSQIGSQTTAPSGIDFEQVYAALFQKLNAQKIAFTAVSASSTGNVADIYALYKADVAESMQLSPGETDFSIQVAAVDLNADGTPEALVYEDLPGFCGTGGCTLDIYQLQKSKWVKVSSLLAGGDIGLANTSTEGYTDLFLSVAGDIGSQTDVVRYSWDGTEYQPGAAVAAWNGTTFDIAQ